MSHRLCVLTLTLICCACSRPAAVQAPAATPPPPRPSQAPAREAAPAAREAEPDELAFTVRSANGEPVPAYATMDAGSRVAFEADNGSGGLVLGTSAFVKDGSVLTYWNVETESGRGWIWDKHVAVHPRPKGVARAEPAEHPGLRMETDLVTPEAPEPAAEIAAAAIRPAAADVLKINAGGDEVDIFAHLVAGQYTIVDFTSVHCGPCRRAAPKLEKIARESPNVVLRIVDIDRPGGAGIDWQSPVAIQYGLSSIPEIRVYGPTGSLEADGDRVWGRLEQIARGI